MMSSRQNSMAANILLVEDDAVIRTSICAELQKAGYEVTEAQDGDRAVELLLYERRFDLVVTDFVLPKLHGFHLVELIHSQLPKIPIIIISGYLSEIAASVVLKGLAE